MVTSPVRVRPLGAGIDLTSPRNYHHTVQVLCRFDRHTIISLVPGHRIAPVKIPVPAGARLRFFDTARRVGLAKILDPETDKVIGVDAWETTVREKG